MNINILKVAFCSVLFAVACTEPIDVTLHEGANNALVVEGVITNETKQHYVRLSRTTSYFYNQKAPAELGATVTITDGTETFILTDDDNDGVYLTEPDVAGIPGHTYTLNIELANGDTYSATDRMPIANYIDSLYYEYGTKLFGVEMKEYMYTIYCNITEVPNQFDGYQFYFYFNDSLYNEPIKKWILGSDGVYDGKNHADGVFLYYYEADSLPSKPLLTVDLLTVSEDYYNFISELTSETVANMTILEGPPANIRTNISNGAVGFFSAKAKTTASLKLNE